MKKNTLAVQSVVISFDETGQRIDNFLLARLKGVPKSVIYRMLRKGEARINKRRIKPEYKLAEGDIVRIPPVCVSCPDIPVSVKLDRVAVLADCILFEDDHILVLNKPSGTAVHGGSGLSFGVIEALRALRPQARFLELVHRLDRETSGVLLIAKRRSALRALHEQLRLKKMQKNYLALVKGQWQPDSMVMQAPLMENTLQGNAKKRVLVSSQGKPAETHFKVEEYFGHATLVKAMPVTGRTHQIRVHALHAGHPIAFDDRYGDHEFDKLLKDTGLNRLFLHAAALRFEHPANGETLYIEAPMSRQLHACLAMLRNPMQDKILLKNVAR